MSFQCEELPDGSVALLGELDVNHASDAKDALCSVLTRGNVGIVNLSGITGIDYAGVQVLLSAKRSAESLRRDLSFSHPSSVVGEAFQLLGIRAAAAAEGTVHGR